MKKKEIWTQNKAIKTINFDEEVLIAAERRARSMGTSLSNLINHIVKNTVINEVEFYREMAKVHYLKFQEYNYAKEEAERRKADQEKTETETNIAKLKGET